MLTAVRKTNLLMKKKLTLIVTFFCAEMNSRGTAIILDDFQIVFCRVLFPFNLITEGPQIFHMTWASSIVTWKPLIAFVRKVVSKSALDGHCNISYNSRAFEALFTCRAVNIFMFCSTVCTNVVPESPSGRYKMCNPDRCSTKRRSVIPYSLLWSMKAFSSLLW